MPRPPESDTPAILTLRLTTEEATTVGQAATALRSTPSGLIQSAIVDAAHRLGLDSAIPSPTLMPPSAWPDAPRRATATSKRISVSLDRLSSMLLTRCALYLGISRSQFAVGAALRYVANLRHPRSSPLSTVHVPAQYRHP